MSQPGSITPATITQTMPVSRSTGRPVMPSVMEALGGYPCAQRDYRARIRLGAERYGSELTTQNGRCFTTDAYQEALDLLGYLVGAEMEMRDSGLSGTPELEALGVAAAHALGAVVAIGDLLEARQKEPG